MTRISSPSSNQSFSNTKEHDNYLCDGKEAPYRCLFHEIRREQTGQVWSTDEEKNTLNNHAPLFIHGKEGSKH